MAGGGINSTEDKQIVFPKHNPSWETTGLDEAQAGIKIPRRNINNLRYVDDTTLMTESKELKSLLMKVKEENEKFLNIQKTKIMALHGK